MTINESSNNYLLSPEWEAFEEQQKAILGDPYLSGGEKAETLGYGAPEETLAERIARDPN